jgi:hypothetical protein
VRFIMLPSGAERASRRNASPRDSHRSPTWCRLSALRLSRAELIALTLMEFRYR